ncbi:class F sortase [Micromonospora sp. DT227]|uniref:class F sortase n=1 Tax=Micromonospora sp. DT227 TaxID=3393433 RepID=UPI003CE7A27C
MGDEAVRAAPSTVRGTSRRSARRTATTLALALCGMAALTGAGMVGASWPTGASSPPPQPPAAAAPPSPSQQAPDASPDATPNRSALAASPPSRITIPRIGVRADVLALGVNDDGTVQVPPLDQAMNAGWYKLGASPGELGNAVIMGHVDSAKIGPAVFFRLGELRPGDTVSVERADRTEVTFQVDGLKSYPKDQFPTELVYGPSDRASLRVITCGGRFDEQKRSYTDNVIVFATMTGVRQR